MTLSRREALAAGAGGAALLLGGCARLTPLAREGAGPGASFDRFDPETAMLRRLTVEPAGEDRALLRAVGREAFVGRLLDASEPEPVGLTLRLRRMDGLWLDPVTAMDVPKERVIEDLQAAAILRATYGANPLRERVASFLAEHFNVSARKGDGAFYRGTEERLIREGGMGSFPALLAGVARGPAMLAYLDNDANRKGHPNENFARELLELHTLGVDGGYTQRDVQEVARCFTGWTVERRFLRPRGAFRFDESVHDGGAKTVLGRAIAPGGVEQGKAVLGMLASHPATGRHLARRLTLFLTGSPHPATEARAAEAYRASGGEIRATVGAIVRSEHLREAEPALRRPADLLVASLRATGAETDGGAALRGHLRAMGQPPYEWPMPDGYPVGGREWGSGMLARWTFAHALAHGRIEGTSVRTGDPSALALDLAGPEFQWT